MKLTNKQICAVVIVLCIFAFIFILGLSLSGKTELSGGKGFTKLYFNADTDLPDSSLYLKNLTKAIYEIETNRTYWIKITPVHEIEVNKTYCINFTIASFERTPVTYTYVVESNVLNLTKQVTLMPEGSTSICLTITPRESDKWRLNSTTSTEWEDVIDLTKNSWLAERRDFEILVRKEGLPTIVEENYRLPISTNVSHFGRILHANISIDELKRKPFEKEYVTEYAENFETTRNIDLIDLSINGDKLYLKAKSKKLRYTSDKQLFSIRLIKPVDVEELEISPESYIEEVQEIYFWYRIK
ncbi:hypothetical protein CW714_08995 [Methanophagales archaeon]|nr:MAG: hypothetical protein CW714_08995 [Methanophagales archaeon]